MVGSMEGAPYLQGEGQPQIELHGGYVAKAADSDDIT